MPGPSDQHEVARACAQRQQALLAGASDASSPDAILFAALISARDIRSELALTGWSRAQLDALVARHFPHCAQPVTSACPVAVVLQNEMHADFVAGLRALLLEHQGPLVRYDDTECLASLIAHACLRPDHLWRDLGLSGRDAVSAMLERYFPTLVARNVANLRWKKFLAQELALAKGAEPGPAPGCPGCEDFAFCFPTSR
jgi:nitrogen fixation protein NifQ